MMSAVQISRFEQHPDTRRSFAMQAVPARSASTGRLQSAATTMHHSIARLGPESVRVLDGVIQRTPAEDFAARGKGEEDPLWALIGTDQYSQPLVSAELEAATALDMQLPSYLARFLADEGLKWDPKSNELWMNKMIKEKRIFVVQHTDIEWLLDHKRRDLFDKKVKQRVAQRKVGTWEEVNTLLQRGYDWYRGLLIPPDMTEKYIASVESQIKQEQEKNATH
jgi:hypothetical protein